MTMMVRIKLRALALVANLSHVPSIWKKLLYFGVLDLCSSFPEHCAGHGITKVGAGKPRSSFVSIAVPQTGVNDRQR